MKGILTTIMILKRDREGEVLRWFITLPVRKRSEPATAKRGKTLGELSCRISGLEYGNAYRQPSQQVRVTARLIFISSGVDFYHPRARHFAVKCCILGFY